MLKTFNEIVSKPSVLKLTLLIPFKHNHLIPSKKNTHFIPLKEHIN